MLETREFFLLDIVLGFLQAAFVPSSDSAFDTSYFTSRYSWNPSDENILEGYELENSSDDGSVSGSSSCVSNRQDDAVSFRVNIFSFVTVYFTGK
jgi:hypothetical protein